MNYVQWEPLESRREQFCLVMLYKILKQNVYFPSEYIPDLSDFCTETCQYQLQTRYCHVFRLSEPYYHTNVYKYSIVRGRAIILHLLVCFFYLL